MDPKYPDIQYNSSIYLFPDSDEYVLEFKVTNRGVHISWPTTNTFRSVSDAHSFYALFTIAISNCQFAIRETREHADHWVEHFTILHRLLKNVRPYLVHIPKSWTDNGILSIFDGIPDNSPTTKTALNIMKRDYPVYGGDDLVQLGTQSEIYIGTGEGWKRTCIAHATRRLIFLADTPAPSTNPTFQKSIYGALSEKGSIGKFVKSSIKNSFEKQKITASDKEILVYVSDTSTTVYCAMGIGRLILANLSPNVCKQSSVIDAESAISTLDGWAQATVSVIPATNYINFTREKRLAIISALGNSDILDDDKTANTVQSKLVVIDFFAAIIPAVRITNGVEDSVYNSIVGHLRDLQEFADLPNEFKHGMVCDMGYVYIASLLRVIFISSNLLHGSKETSKSQLDNAGASLQDKKANAKMAIRAIIRKLEMPPRLFEFITATTAIHDTDYNTIQTIGGYLADDNIVRNKSTFMGVKPIPKVKASKVGTTAKLQKIVLFSDPTAMEKFGTLLRAGNMSLSDSMLVVICDEMDKLSGRLPTLPPPV